ncbi:MAG: hypothetical protein ACJAVI_005562 [Candidatus Azotimanducaceae bacterium]|jgi:hypothetical protein
MVQPGDWFQLSQYQANKDPVYWRDSIYSRSVFSDLLTLFVQSGVQSVAIAEFFKEFIYIGFPSPYVLPSSSVQLVRKSERKSRKPGSEFSIEKSLISAAKTELQSKEPDLKFAAAVFRTARAYSPSSHTFLEGELDQNSDVLLVAIDLNQDTETLQADFLRLVQHRQAKAKRVDSNRALKEIDFQRWFTYGVLPCFDLLLWQEATGTKLTNEAMGALIWPDGDFNRADRVRKQSIPLLERVFSERIYRRLLRKTPGR